MPDGAQRVDILSFARNEVTRDGGGVAGDDRNSHASTVDEVTA
jgi:hypothetical protein